ncbi:MAG TPA: alpha/beta fold hydrolase [Oxalicibacterium sp.]|nr:alpha/beta fold hydrolase [Oxalicibacterium sp.]
MPTTSSCSSLPLTLESEVVLGAGTYVAPWWLPGGHLQTIYPAKCIRTPDVAYRRERWTTPDQDFIDLDFVDGDNGHPFIVLFHGLEGSSHSHYARSLMAHIRSLGWSGVVVHFRGCSGELNLAPRFYHSGDATEIDWILRKLAPLVRGRGATKFYASGVSLGANALLRWLGESQHKAEIVDAACAISAPLDLAGGGMALGRGFNMIYTNVFLKTLKAKCVQKLVQFPKLFDKEAMLNARDLYAFDNIVTAPLHGFLNTEDYWKRASAKYVLSDVTLPTLVLNARNDPFLPARFLPDTAAPAVKLEQPEHGGHVGFASAPFPGRLCWLPQRMTQFLQSGS